jgi:hypothetical protein
MSHTHRVSHLPALHIRLQILNLSDLTSISGINSSDRLFFQHSCGSHQNAAIKRIENHTIISENILFKERLVCFFIFFL